MSVRPDAGADRRPSPAVGSDPAAWDPAAALRAIRHAAEGLAGIAVRTPLLAAPWLEQRLGVPVWFKAEHLQPVGAFKIRGAYTAIARLSPRARAAGVITYSSGNHGQAVAMAAQLLGTRAVVVMPDHAPKIKIAGVERLGGEVRFGGTTSATRQRAAEAMAEAEGLTVVPPFDHPDVITGQATCGLEILDDLPDVEAILCPVGGGGLLAGLCRAAAGLGRTVRLVAVEPTGAAKLAAARAAGEPVPLDRTDSIADGLLPLRIGRLTFPVIHRMISDVILVEDEAIITAMRLLYHESDITAEPSGAATIAALLGDRFRPEGPVVAIISGGNVDPHFFQRVITA